MGSVTDEINALIAERNAFQSILSNRGVDVSGGVKLHNIQGWIWNFNAIYGTKWLDDQDSFTISSGIPAMQIHKIAVVTLANSTTVQWGTGIMFALYDITQGTYSLAYVSSQNITIHSGSGSGPFSNVTSTGFTFGNSEFHTLHGCDYVWCVM